MPLFFNKALYDGLFEKKVRKSGELSSIVDYSRVNPAIDTDYFPNTNSANFWSSSPYANYSNHAWIIYFNYGYGSYDYRYYNTHVRLVRGGQ